MQITRNFNLKDERLVQDYSRDLCNALRATAKGTRSTGPVGKLSEEMRQAQGEGASPNELWVSEAILCRALTVETFNAGAALVGQGMNAIQDVLRGFMVVGRAGAIIRTGLDSNQTYPFFSADPTWAWGAESDTMSVSTPTTGAANSTPCRAVAAIDVSDQLLMQSDAGQALASTLLAGAGYIRDKAAIQGTGVDGEPLGVLYSAGTNEVDPAGVAMTLAKAASFERKAVDSGADPDKLVWIASPDTKEKWTQIQRWTGASVSLWSDDNTVLGRPALTTKACPSGRIILGQWDKLSVDHYGASGGVIRLIIDPFTQALTGKTRFTANMYVTTLAMRPQCFTVSTSSAIL